MVRPENRNAKYSLSEDSEGNKLPKGQKKFFRDSKVKDDNGNLLVVYHGTIENFTTFGQTKTRNTMDIQGNFFSPWKIDVDIKAREYLVSDFDKALFDMVSHGDIQPSSKENLKESLKYFVIKIIVYLLVRDISRQGLIPPFEYFGSIS